MGKKNDIIGKKFGMLTVLEKVTQHSASLYRSGWTQNNYSRRNEIYLCDCDCGEFAAVTKNYLFNKTSSLKHCGCRINLSDAAIKGYIKTSFNNRIPLNKEGRTQMDLQLTDSEITQKMVDMKRELIIFNRLQKEILNELNRR